MPQIILLKYTYSLFFFWPSKDPNGKCWINPNLWAIRICSSSDSWLRCLETFGEGWKIGPLCSSYWKEIWFILASSFSLGSNNVNKLLTLSMKLLSTDGDWLGPCWSSWSSSDVDGLKQVVKHCDSRLKNAVKCRPICCQMGELFAILSLEIKSNVRMGIVAKLFSESFWSHFWNLTNKTAFLWRVSLLVLDDQLIGNYWILKDQLLKSIHFIRHFCD